MNRINTVFTIAAVFSTGLWLLKKIMSRPSKKSNQKQLTKKQLKEIENNGKRLSKEDEIKYPHSFFLPISEDLTEGYFINNPYRGVLIVGGAGSGKTETFVKNIIERATGLEFSGIIYDYKYPSLSNIRYSLGKTFNLKVKNYVINFEDLKQSNRVNPLHPSYLKSVAYAEEYATTIVNNLMPETIKKPDFWSRSAIALLQASIWYFKDHYPEQCNLPNVVTFIQQPTKTVLSALRKDELCAQLISSILTAFDNNAEGQLSGTVGTLQIALNKINTPEIAYILSGNDFSLDLNDPIDPKMLCIGNSPQMQETYGPIISLICTVALKMMNQDNKHHSMLLLDEAPTLYIPKLENVPATGRERKIAVIYIAQDISQIVDRYGKEKKDTIIANLANQFWGRVSHHETAEYISKLFGKHEITRRSYSVNQNTGQSSGGIFSGHSSTSSGHSNSYSDSIVDQEVLKTTDIYNFTPGTFAYVIVDYRKRNIQDVARFKYNSNYVNYSLKPIELGNPEIDAMANYKAIQQGVKELLANNIVEENKKEERKNKNNSNELF
jgi:hypothetical protein